MEIKTKSFSFKYKEDVEYLKSLLSFVDDKGKRHIENIIKHFDEEKDMLTELNTPKAPILKKWNPSECPSCGHDFSDYEPCDDGYYLRAFYLERCPYCGQALDWHEV